MGGIINLLTSKLEGIEKENKNTNEKIDRFVIEHIENTNRIKQIELQIGLKKEEEQEYTKIRYERLEEKLRQITERMHQLEEQKGKKENQEIGRVRETEKKIPEMLRDPRLIEWEKKENWYDKQRLYTTNETQ